MALKDIRDEADLNMMGILEALEGELRNIRSGQASVTLIENVPVKCYGGVSPLKTVAGISRPEMRLLAVKPFDPSITGEIERALLAADIGITPVSDGKLIRLPFPPLTEETRRKQVASVKSRAEATRIALRNFRRDANKAVDAIKKESAAPEDDCFRMRDEIQKLLDAKQEEIEKLVEKKTKELME